MTLAQHDATKPLYRVPSMAEIASIPWNGLTVASTFSGCGGSCLGYRMAGYRVLWANEFAPSAQSVYRANHPDSILDTRDIRTVTAEEILTAIQMNKGDLDVLDGSPPCQAFSTAGSRERGWGTQKKYAHGAAQCNEQLFAEYIRLVHGLQPKVLIAENVSGLVKGTAKGYFKEILAGLKACGYQVKPKLLDAQWLGVPQMRQRVIFIGVRNDLKMTPVFPRPLPYRYSVAEAVPWIVAGKYGQQWRAATVPSPTVSAQLAYNAMTNHQGLELVESFSSPARSIEESGGSRTTSSWSHGTCMLHDLVAPSRRNGQGFQYHDVHPDMPCATVTIASPGNDLGVMSRMGRRKLTIAELKRICAFPDDFVLTGTYAQQWACLGNSVPPVMMCAIASVVRDDILLPSIS